MILVYKGHLLGGQLEYLLTFAMESFMEMGIGFGPFLKFKLNQLESSQHVGMINEKNLSSI